MNNSAEDSYQRRYVDLNAAKFQRFVSAGPTIETRLPTNIEVEVYGSYGASLFDPRWKTKRSLVLDRDLHQCVICQTSQNLQVHHRQYHFVKKFEAFKMPWDYESHLLVTLCESCHRRGHSKYKVPIIQK